MIRPELRAAFDKSENRDYPPCKHTLAEQALYRVDAFEDWIAAAESTHIARNAALALRESQVARREAAVALRSRITAAVAIVVMVVTFLANRG